MKVSLRVVVRVLLAFLAAHTASGQTIRVPADQPTIQAGIDAATNEATVLVAPGTYYENIDFKGKAITVASSGGAAATIIDGSKGQNAAVLFQNGEGRTSVLHGSARELSAQGAFVACTRRHQGLDGFDGLDPSAGTDSGAV